MPRELRHANTEFRQRFPSQDLKANVVFVVSTSDIRHNLCLRGGDAGCHLRSQNLINATVEHVAYRLTKADRASMPRRASKIGRASPVEPRLMETACLDRMA